MCCVAWRYRTESTGDLQGLVPQVPFIMERTLPEWKGEKKVSWGERIEERQWENLGVIFFFSLHHISAFVRYVNDFWHLDTHMFWGYAHGAAFFFPPPAAVTVGKQYATPSLPSLKGVCFCTNMCTVICLTKPKSEAHTEISNGYDDEAFWQILQCTLLSAHEMEGGDPFRSLMLWARV